jgi:hypothetical protein
MDEQQASASAAALEAQVAGQIGDALAQLTGTAPQPDATVPQPAVPPVAPLPPQPEPTPQPAPQPEPTPQPEVPPEQPQEPAYTTEPTKADVLRGMFSHKPVDPVAPAPAAELPPDTPIAEPQNMDDRARNAWVESRNREKQLRQFAAQQKQQLEALTAKQDEFQKEREELAKALKDRDDKLKEANERLGKLDLSGSVEFRKRYDQPLEQAEANLDHEIHDAIEGADTPEQVAEIRNYILGDDRQFQDYISGLDIDTQGRLIEKRRTLVELSAQRQQAIDDWQNTSRGLTDIAARQNAADRTIARQHNAEAAIRRNTTELPPELRPYVMTDEGFADEVKTANEAFTSFMTTATDEEMAAAAHLGHFMPAMNRALMLALREAQQAQEELLRMRGIRNIPTRSAPASRPAPKPVAPAKPTVAGLEEQALHGIEDTLGPLMGGIAAPRH